MPEPRTTAIAISTETPRAGDLLEGSGSLLTRTGAWATDTAQEFGALVAALMGPAVFSGYAFAAWSLAANLGWTDSFVFTSGPLSNWLVWLTIALMINVAASILKKHTRQTG